MAKAKKKILNWLTLYVGVPIAYFLMRLNRLTWRKTFIGYQPPPGSPPFIIALWHGDLLTGTEYIKKVLPLDITVSHSRDGELVARLIQLDGAGAIRGSSSRGQMGALRGMLRSIKDQHNVCIAVDGPRGPATIVKPGITLIASQTRTAILPLAMMAKDAWYFESWDRAFIPKPFTKIYFIRGTILTTPPEATREQLEAIRAALETELKNLHLGLPDL